MAEVKFHAGFLLRHGIRRILGQHGINYTENPGGYFTLRDLNDAQARVFQRWVNNNCSSNSIFF